MAIVEKFVSMQEQDLAILEKWFEDEEVRARLEGMLPLQEWYGYIRENINYTAWLAYEGERVIGLMMIECEDDGTASIGVIIQPALRGKGYGRALVQEVLGHEQFAAVQQWVVGIEEDNIACIKCFLASGFTKDHPDADEDGFYNLTYKEETS